MMKYMDSCISEEEADELRKHVSECEICKEDFLIYDEILEEFSNMDNIIQAPEGFEQQVMAKIEALEPIYINSEARTDNILCTLWGIFSILAGIGTILFVNKDAITSFMLQTPSLSGYASMFASVESYVLQFKDGFLTSINTIVQVVSSYAVSLKYVSLIAFVLLVAAQYFIYKKDKVEI